MRMPSHLRDVPRSTHGAPAARRANNRSEAFTLLEVMIAFAVFFIAMFAILDLTSQSLSSARQLQNVDIDISSLAATLSLTNSLEEGPLPTDVVDLFEDLHPGYSCNGDIFEVGSNGLFQVNFQVHGRRGKKPVASSMSILLFRPGSASSFRLKTRP